MKAAVLLLAAGAAVAQPACDKPVYLTFDTGHMGVAPLIAETLKKHNAKATFFLASEPTLTGGTTLDETWAPWWRERVAEGHDFGSHTWEHDIFLEDVLDADGKVVRFKVRTQAGINPPVVRELTPEQYCDGLKKVGERFTAMTGRALGPIFRAPAGRSSPALLASGLLAFGFMFFFWEDANAGVRAALESWHLVESLLQWLDRVGLQAFRSALTIIIVLAAMLPVIILLSLLLVALCMTPAIVRLVAERRFPLLEKKRGGSLLQSLGASLAATALALVLIVLSMPLWLIPPLVMVLPPLIWGWLTYQVFGFDVLAEHASAEERRALLKEHRLPMLVMGVVCGYLGAAPSLIWAFSAMVMALAPFLVLVSIWLYTLVFAFSTAWFAHYAMAALQARRADEPVAESAVVLEV